MPVGRFFKKKSTTTSAGVTASGPVRRNRSQGPESTRYTVPRPTDAGTPSRHKASTQPPYGPHAFASTGPASGSAGASTRATSDGAVTTVSQTSANTSSVTVTRTEETTRRTNSGVGSLRMQSCGTSADPAGSTALNATAAAAGVHHGAADGQLRAAISENAEEGDEVTRFLHSATAPPEVGMGDDADRRMEPACSSSEDGGSVLKQTPRSPKTTSDKNVAVKVHSKEKATTPSPEDLRTAAVVSATEERTATKPLLSASAATAATTATAHPTKSSGERKPRGAAVSASASAATGRAAEADSAAAVDNVCVSSTEVWPPDNASSRTGKGGAASGKNAPHARMKKSASTKSLSAAGNADGRWVTETPNSRSPGESYLTTATGAGARSVSEKETSAATRTSVATSTATGVVTAVPSPSKSSRRASASTSPSTGPLPASSGAGKTVKKPQLSIHRPADPLTNEGDAADGRNGSLPPSAASSPRGKGTVGSTSPSTLTRSEPGSATSTVAAAAMTTTTTAASPAQAGSSAQSAPLKLPPHSRVPSSSSAAGTDGRGPISSRRSLDDNAPSVPKSPILSQMPSAATASLPSVAHNRVGSVSSLAAGTVGNSLAPSRSLSRKASQIALGVSPSQAPLLSSVETVEPKGAEAAVRERRGSNGSRGGAIPVPPAATQRRQSDLERATGPTGAARRTPPTSPAKMAEANAARLRSRSQSPPTLSETKADMDAPRRPAGASPPAELSAQECHAVRLTSPSTGALRRSAGGSDRKSPGATRTGSFSDSPSTNVALPHIHLSSPSVPTANRTEVPHARALSPESTTAATELWHVSRLTSGQAEPVSNGDSVSTIHLSTKEGYFSSHGSGGVVVPRSTGHLPRVMTQSKLTATIASTPRELRNFGATCYMNATLQCILYTPYFLETLEADIHRISSADGFIVTGPAEHATEPTGAKTGGTSPRLPPLTELGREREQSHLAVHLPATFSLEELGHGSRAMPTGQLLLSVKGSAATYNDEFSGNGQNDAHEFLRTILYVIHDEVNRGQGRSARYEELKDVEKETEVAAMGRWMRRLRAVDDSTVYDFFGGVLRSRCECKTCGHVSLTFDPFLDLSLPVVRDELSSSEASKPKGKGTRIGRRDADDDDPSTGPPASVDNILRESFLDDTVEPLTGGNQLLCEKCKKLRNGTRRCKVLKWPRTLVLHLKRFDEKGQKCKARVAYPQTFVAEDVRYRLFGVLCHSGTASSGHYTSYVSVSSWASDAPCGGDGELPGGHTAADGTHHHHHHHEHTNSESISASHESSGPSTRERMASSGSSGGAFAKRFREQVQRWYLCNDNHISEVDAKEAGSALEKAYILFYCQQ